MTFFRRLILWDKWKIGEGNIDIQRRHWMPFLRSQKRIVSVAALMYIRIFGKFFSSIRSSSVYHGLFYIPSSTHFVKLFNFGAILLIYIHKPLSLSFSVQYTEQNQVLQISLQPNMCYIFKMRGVQWYIKYGICIHLAHIFSTPCTHLAHILHTLCTHLAHTLHTSCTHLSWLLLSSMFM